MCGRYGRRGDKQKMAEAFHANVGLDELYESEDCAPGSIQPVVRVNEDGEREFTSMRWGFKLSDRHLFNTRSEGVESANFWKQMFAKNRCIIPASSYFEWPDVLGPKPKCEVTLPGQEFLGIAGVWSPWQNLKTGQWEKTFSAFTSEPNVLIKTIHDRQPVILERREFAEWLSEAPRPPIHLLRIMPEERMSMKIVEAPSPAGPIQAGLFG
jgi:putative SOS response-associated peptidase YedK